MSHVRTLIFAIGLSTAHVAALALPPHLRWRVRLLLWLGVILLGLGW